MGIVELGGDASAKIRSIFQFFNMAKSKYSQAVVETICNASATNGGDESGWVAGGISKPTFYDWLNRYPDFSDSVEKARLQFQKNASERLKTLASERLTEVLENGQTIKWKSQKTVRRERWIPGENGSPDWLKWYQIDTEESTHYEHRPTPQWAIERVIAKPLQTLEQLIAVASEYGLQLTIKDADLFSRYLTEVTSQDSSSDNGAGLTEEATDQIRARILGLEQ